jgi:hemerythrin-like domain-containing protein
MSQRSLVEYFTSDHRDCDERWAGVEDAAQGGASEAVRRAFRRFDHALRTHLEMEERVLFPAFEDATGMHDGGPTFVMRMEHEQMRGLLDQMAAALAGGATQELLDQGDSLLMLIQQHNAKEEGMLYPMAQRALGAHWSALRAALEPIHAGRDAD